LLLHACLQQQGKNPIPGLGIFNLCFLCLIAS
jgi:hypothetical protein